MRGSVVACLRHAPRARWEVDITSVGIRNFGGGVPFLEANWERVRMFWARERANWSLAEIVAPLRERPIYVSLDIDVMDAGMMPATGTPEPGGLTFDEVCAVRAARGGPGCRCRPC